MPLIALPRDTRASLVWSCVIFGGLGTEVFSVSVVWYLVESLGSAGAYYLVPQLAAATFSGLLGAGVLDRFAPLRVTLYAEVIRVLAALVAFVTVLAGWPVWILVVQAVVVSMVRPHHDAGVMAGLSRLGIERDALRSVSSLVDNTFRIARILGPALASGLSILFGSRYVLAASAVLFGCALVLFFRLDRSAAAGIDEPPPEQTDRAGVRAAVVRSIGLVGKSRLLAYAFVTQALNAGAWYLGFVFAMALLLSSGSANDAQLSSFGVVTLCYGLGNVVAGLVVATRPIAEPPRYLVAGRALAGVGYLLLAADHHLWWLCVWAAVTAAGTPFADLAFIKTVQGGYRWADVSKLYRFKMIGEYAGMLVALGCGPLLIAHLGIAGTISACGAVLVVTAVLGVAGLARPPRRPSKGEDD
ncbi:hypothetical protein [Amycolatopsis anabasis]|uniref:hypothetical protein n=1 Tax=Amycolatopsis anabasis TaxID=1840409 RepID=UPI00131CF23C|nr:hypothetical protein [Amycolatopsis anabasis]